MLQNKCAVPVPKEVFFLLVTLSSYRCYQCMNIIPVVLERRLASLLVVRVKVGLARRGAA